MDQNREKLASILPQTLKGNVDRFKAAAALAFNKDAKLQQCSTSSILTCVYQACQLGLEVNTQRQHAFLIPYGKECTLQVGAKGMVELAYRTGVYTRIESRLVGPDDFFLYEFNPSLEFSHKPAGAFPDNKAIAAYAMAWIKGEQDPLIEVMWRDDIEKVRRASRASGSGPWTQWWGEMARKTVIKRLLKSQRMSEELSSALAIDNEHYDPAHPRLDAPKVRGSQALVNRLRPQPQPEEIEPEETEVNPADPHGIVEDEPEVLDGEE